MEKERKSQEAPDGDQSRLIFFALKASCVCGVHGRARNMSAQANSGLPAARGLITLAGDRFRAFWPGNRCTPERLITLGRCFSHRQVRAINMVNSVFLICVAAQHSEFFFSPLQRGLAADDKFPPKLPFRFRQSWCIRSSCGASQILAARCGHTPACRNAAYPPCGL